MGNSDSKAKFRESVYKLSNDEISSRNLEFWDRLWKIPTTAEEVFALVHPDDVRTLRQNQPGNLSTIFEQAISQLTQIVETPLAKYYPQALNCVRLLTRLVAFMQENPNDDFIQNLFWEIQDTSESNKSAAHRLLLAIMGLLFLPDFTVPSLSYNAYKQQSDATPRENHVYPSLLWCSGVGYPDASTNMSSSLDKNRKEVLKLLLVCFSGNLYHSPENHSSMDNRWLQVATSASFPFVPTLFHSLLNVIVTYDPVGWGVPYMGSVLSDERELLVDIALQVLLVLLDYGDQPTIIGKVTVHSDQTKQGHTTCPISPTSANMYRKILSSLNRREDFDIIYSGIAKLLNNIHESLNTYLPNSIKQIKCHQEILILLWKLLDDNEGFLKYVLQESDITQIVVPLLFLMHQGRKEPARVGLIHICTFIMLLLSGERDFGVSLNKPLEQKLPTDLPHFTGNHADLLIVVLHKVIVNGFEKLNSVYNCFLTIISNISPYCRKLNLVASVRLLRLFKLFSQPRYLYDNEANHHLVFFLLDSFNNVVQYQYEGNPHLVYAIMQNKELFTLLNDLPMPENDSTKEKSSEEKAASQEETSCPEEKPLPEIVEAPAALPIPLHDSKFVATCEWAMEWKKRLPLQTILRLLQHLVPQIDNLVAKSPGGTLDESMILSFIRGTTMVGLLPVPHPIVIRKYQPNQYTNLWFTTFTWGIIFLRNQVLPLYDGATIKLFTINVL